MPLPNLSPPTEKEIHEGWRRSWFVIAAGCVLFGIVALWSCGRNAYRNYQIASAAVDQFHQQLNAGDYQQIYDNATDEFRNWGAEDKLTHFFDNIRGKMGTAGKASTAGFHVNWRNGVVWVDQTFNTQFEKGKAQEYFVWKIQQDQAHLYNYRIDSPNMHEPGATK